MLRVFSILCLVLSIVHAGPARTAETPTDWNKLFRGDVIVEAVNGTDGLPGVRASFCVTSARERIWSVLTDYEDFPKIYRGIDKIQVDERNSSGAKVEFWYSAPFLKIFTKKLHYVLARRYTIPGAEIRWTRVSGDLKRIEGSWEIRDTSRPGVYLLVYSSYVDPGWYVPVGLVRNGAMKEAADMARRVRSWIEKPPAKSPGTQHAPPPS